ncbi:MAG: AAA family ATPase [Candidatus Micrarchaeota archaeon]|nr:AAA family ATPase [Candidatus Micrarchaeota archaeon]
MWGVFDLSVEYAENFYENSFDDARQSVLRAMNGQKTDYRDEANLLLVSQRIFALACSEKYGNRALWLLDEAGPFLLDYLRKDKYSADMLSPFFTSFFLGRQHGSECLETQQATSDSLREWGMPEELIPQVVSRLYANTMKQSPANALPVEQPPTTDLKKPETPMANLVSKILPTKKDAGQANVPASEMKKQPANPVATDLQAVTPAEIADYFRKSVRSQDVAVEDFAIAIKDHACRPQGVKTSNILVLGPTGCGKTYLGRISAKYLGVPFGEAKMSSKSATGYIGDNLTSIFQDVLDKSPSPGALNRSIMFLDEIDKLSLLMDDKGFASKLQNELIGFVESSAVRAETGVRTTQPIDTTEMLFIGAGAFIGLNYIIAERVNACGNVSDVEKIIRGEIVPKIKLSMPDEELYAQIIPDDLVRYGLRPELVGRFPVVTFVRPLKTEDLIDILKNSESSPLAQQLRLLSEGYKTNCKVDESAYELIALKAVELKTGARALEPICNQVFRDIKFNAKKNGSEMKISVDYVKKALSGNGKTMLFY